MSLHTCLGATGRFRETQQDLCRLRQPGFLTLRSKAVDVLHQGGIPGLVNAEKHFREPPGHLSGIDARMRERADRHLGRPVALAEELKQAFPPVQGRSIS